VVQPTFSTPSRLTPRLPLHTCTNLNLTERQSTCPLSFRGANSHLRHLLQDEEPTLTHEALLQLRSAVHLLPDAVLHLEVMVDPKGATLTHIDPAHCQDLALPDTTEVGPDHIPPDRDLRPGDVVVDVIVQDAMEQGGGVRVTAVTAAMMIGAEAEAAAEVGEEGDDERLAGDQNGCFKK